MSGSQNPWIILTGSAVRGPRTVVVARDDRGRRVVGVAVEDRVREFVVRAAAPLERDASLAIFSTVPDHVRLRELVDEFRGGVPAHPVRLGRERWRRRAPLQLPIDIVGVGRTAEPTLERIAASDWFMRATPGAAAAPEAVDSAALPHALRARPRDVVIAAEEDARRAVAVAGKLPVGFRPRLILVVGTAGESRPSWLNSVVPPHGVAIAYAAVDSTQVGVDFSAGVLERVATDVVLHDALRLSGDDAGVRESPELIADPGTNEVLSLEATAHRMIRRADDASEGVATSPMRGLAWILH